MISNGMIVRYAMLTKHWKVSRIIYMHWLDVRGHIYCNLAQYENSLSDLNKSLQIDPGNESALKNKEETYRMLKQYDDALINVNKSLEINPDYVDAYWPTSISI